MRALALASRFGSVNPFLPRLMPVLFLGKGMGLEILDSAACRTGADLRALRKMRGKTLTELARAIGRSTGWLSQVERGRARVTTDHIHKFAAELEVAPSMLVAAPGEDLDADVVRADARRSYGRRASGLQEELVGPGLDGLTEVIHSRFEPYSARITPRRSAAEEVIYILSGRLMISTSKGRSDLRRGDSMRLRDCDFSWENPSGATTTALWITSPPRG